MSNKKSQAAMEFLMTYGWALLVVLIAIVALAFFGMLNPEKFIPTKCEMAPGLTCMGYNAVTDDLDISDGSVKDNITILLNNGRGNLMTNVTINVTNCLNKDNSDDTIDHISNGETAKFLITCEGLIPSTRFSSSLVIKYHELSGETYLSHVKKGQIAVDVEHIE